MPFQAHDVVYAPHVDDSASGGERELRPDESGGRGREREATARGGRARRRLWIGEVRRHRREARDRRLHGGGAGRRVGGRGARPTGITVAAPATACARRTARPSRRCSTPWCGRRRIGWRAACGLELPAGHACLHLRTIGPTSLAAPDGDRGAGAPLRSRLHGRLRRRASTRVATACCGSSSRRPPRWRASRSSRAIDRERTDAPLAALAGPSPAGSCSNPAKAVQSQATSIRIREREGCDGTTVRRRAAAMSGAAGRGALDAVGSGCARGKAVAGAFAARPAAGGTTRPWRGACGGRAARRRAPRARHWARRRDHDGECGLLGPRQRRSARAGLGAIATGGASGVPPTRRRRAPRSAAHRGVRDRAGLVPGDLVNERQLLARCPSATCSRHGDGGGRRLRCAGAASGSADRSPIPASLAHVPIVTDAGR